MSHQEIYNLIQSKYLATLSTVTPEGTPHGAPIYYAWDPEKLEFSFITPSGTAKKRNLDANNEVCITITDEQELITIKIFGTAQIDSSKASITLHQLASKLQHDSHIVESLPLMKYTDQSKVAYRINLSSIHFDRYSTDVLEHEVITFDQA